MNHNILETIISKAAILPLYILEYGYGEYSATFSGTPTDKDYIITGIYGIYPTLEELDKGIDRFLDEDQSSRWTQCNIRITTINSLGEVDTALEEEYVYLDCEKYRRIFVQDEGGSSKWDHYEYEHLDWRPYFDKEGLEYGFREETWLFTPSVIYP